MKETVIIDVGDDGFIPSNQMTLLLESLTRRGKCKLRVEIDKYKSKRSDNQNRYFWQLCTILSKEFGYTKDEVCDILKFKFLRKSKVDENTGELFEYLGSTSQLNKMEFADFTADVIQWAATLNIILPQPGEQLTIT